MKRYECYIHSSGALMVKTVPDQLNYIVDQKSPHVIKYLGMKTMPSLNQARAYFIQQNGGRQYVDISELKRGDG